MDELVRELENLRVERDEATRSYQRTVERTNERERHLLQQIQRETRRESQTPERQFRNNIRNNRQNPIKRGDVVKITNYHRQQEHGVVGEVIQVTNKMVELRNAETWKEYTRA